MKRVGIVLNLLLSMAGWLALLCGVALADTDGTELKVVDNPQTLTIQLGPEWAGKEFELRTDAGKYPGVVKCFLNLPLHYRAAFLFWAPVSPCAPGWRCCRVQEGRVLFGEAYIGRAGGDNFSLQKGQRIAG